MKKKAIWIGIGIAAVLVIVVIGFTNIDELVYPEVKKTLSQIEVDDSSIRMLTNTYPINTKCEFFLAVGDRKLKDPNWIQEQLGDEKFNQLYKKQEQEILDFWNSMGGSCHLAASPAACFQALRELSEKQSNERESMIFHPTLLNEYQNLQTPEDLKNFYKEGLEEPGCLEKARALSDFDESVFFP